MVEYWQQRSLTGLCNYPIFEDKSFGPAQQLRRTLKLSALKQLSNTNLPNLGGNWNIPQRNGKSKKRQRKAKTKDKQQKEQKQHSGKCLQAKDGDEDSPQMIEFFKEIQKRDLKKYYVKRLATERCNTYNKCPTSVWIKPPPLCEGTSQHV